MQKRWREDADSAWEAGSCLSGQLVINVLASCSSLPVDLLPICRAECTFIVLDRGAEVCAASHDTITGMPAHPLETSALLIQPVKASTWHPFALLSGDAFAVTFMQVRQLYLMAD